MTKDESITLALKLKTEELEKKTHLRENQLKKLENENSEYAAVVADLAECGSKLAITALGGNKQKIKELSEKMTALCDKKNKILAASGIKGIDFYCENCKDTGYKDGVLCDCVKTLASSIMLEDLANRTPVKECGFDNFCLDYYTEPSAKKRMSAILGVAKEYAENFGGNTKENLLFMGSTGLGKTHLSLSIAQKVILKGYNVIYGSAYNLFSDMETEHFSYHTNKSYENAVNCDLLVIDDLGGEFVSPYIQALVYNIVNTRLLAGKPTVINTNLSMSEIENKYTPRVASRLAGEYTAKMFLGSDVRQIKALSK